MEVVLITHDTHDLFELFLLIDIEVGNDIAVSCPLFRRGPPYRACVRNHVAVCVTLGAEFDRDLEGDGSGGL